MANHLHTTDLVNGVNFHHIRTDKFKTTVVCILLRRRLERQNATLIALIPPVLQNGSQEYKTMREINIATERMYGAVFDIQTIKKGEEQIIQFFIEFADGTGIEDGALEFMRGIMLAPLVEDGGFKEEYVLREKENLKTAIEGRKNIKAEYAKLKCIEHMCGGEPFSIYADGYAEDLDGIDGRRLYNCYSELLKTSPIEFIIAGNGEPEFYAEKIRRIFYPGLAALERMPAPIPKAGFSAPNKEQRKIHEEMEITQGKICMGFRAGIEPASCEFFHLLLFNELLGGSASSRLFVNAREKKNLCYYINSFIYRFKSIVFVQSGVDCANFGATAEIVAEQAEQLKQPGSIGDDEFLNAKKSLVMKYRGIPDNQGALIEFYLSQYLLSDGRGVDEVVNSLEAVSKEDVSRAAQRIALDTVYTLGRA